MPNVRERRRKAAHSEVVDLVEQACASRASAICGVHPATIARWIAGTVKPPESALVALRAYVLGPAWPGWRFWDGWLVSPAGDKFHESELLGLPYERQIIKAQRKQIAADKPGAVAPRP